MSDASHELRLRFQQEFSQLQREGKQVALTLSALEAWVLMAQLQLALRHPSNRGGIATIALRLAKQLQGLVAGEGVLKEVAEVGWRPELDEVDSWAKEAARQKERADSLSEALQQEAEAREAALEEAAALRRRVKELEENGREGSG